MSFFSAIKRAFGFGYDDDEEFETVTSDDPEVADDSNPQTSEENSVETVTVDLPPVPVADAQMKAKIFESVVTIFNTSLPEFLAKSVDAERQKQLIAEALDKSVDEYLNSLMVTAEQYAEAKLKNASETARREAEKLRTDMQLLEQQRTSLREQQLSADRRRRALADRVNDLEAQLARVEAEREQFELENKSLLNKVKVADIQPGVVEELTKEIERLKAQAPATPESQEPVVDTAEIERLTAECEKLKNELDLANAQLKDQHAISQAMYSDLQKRYAEEAEARETADKALADAQAELREVREAIATLEQVQDQIGQIEDVIRKRDERIARLKANNKKYKEQIAELKNELMRRRAAACDEGLFALPTDDESAGAVSEEHSRIASDLAAMEDDFECPDWFVAEPAPIPDRPDPAEFGYTEPPKKKRPDNDAQLSLF